MPSSDATAHEAEQILDAVFLAEQTFGDATLRREVLALFEAQCDHLQGRIEAGAAEDAIMAAHTLKGAASAIGARRIASLAGTMETALGEGWDHADVDRLVGHLIDAIAATRREIAALRKDEPHS